MPRRILVVDDQEEHALLLRIFLERMGFDAGIASNGREALEEIDRQLPDLVIMDVMMPEIDGIHALQQLREQEATARLPVVMLTGRSDPRDMFEAWHKGANVYLTKPIDLNALTAAIKRIFPGDSIEELEVDTGHHAPRKRWGLPL